MCKHGDDSRAFQHQFFHSVDDRCWVRRPNRPPHGQVLLTLAYSRRRSRARRPVLPDQVAGLRGSSAGQRGGKTYIQYQSRILSQVQSTTPG